MIQDRGDDDLTIIHDGDESCPAADFQIWCGSDYLEKMNTRPIEDALTARAEKAERERDEARARLAAARRG